MPDPDVPHTDLRTRLSECYDDLTFFDGMDEAIVGVCEVHGREPVVCYDRLKCIGLLVQRGMGWDEAAEYFEYNMAGTHVGPTTPAFLDTPESLYIGAPSEPPGTV
jgi:hypothetical protein